MFRSLWEFLRAWTSVPKRVKCPEPDCVECNGWNA